MPDKESVEAAIAETEKIRGHDASLLFIRNPLAESRQ
jgi:hypothetical protein